MIKVIDEFRNLKEAIELCKHYHIPVRGIYCFESKRRKTIYIGMTQDFAKRFVTHRKSYKTKHGEHRALHEFFDLVGFNKTPVKILLGGDEITYTRRELFILESVLVEIYLTKGYTVLNGKFGHELSKNDYGHIGVKKFSRKKTLIEKYNTLYDLAKVYQFNVIEILRCCKCDIRMYDGFRWMLFDNLNEGVNQRFITTFSIEELTLARSRYESLIEKGYMKWQ